MAWVLFGGLTGLSVAQIVALLITLAVPVLFIAQAAGPYLGKQALIQDMIDTLLPASIAPETSKEFAEKVTITYVNPALAFAGRVARGEDAKLAFVVTGGAYLLFKLLGFVSLITLVYITIVLAFALPKVYELKQKEIDALASKAGAKIYEVWAKLDEIIFKKIKPHTAKTE